mmetsp:Transcript_5014/g.7066  ORF Transcript_5014/g.7066 Transcript_5014/m.7066 type:complete len:137 (-) Transcript_5014:91-501(-)
MSSVRQRPGSSSSLSTMKASKKKLVGNATPRKKQSTADEARSIEMSLRRTNQMLHQELDRVSSIANAIDQDGRVLGDTKSHHKEMKDDIKGAKGALKGLEREKQKERRILIASIVFFYAVVAYVVWTRIRIPFLLW